MKRIILKLNNNDTRYVSADFMSEDDFMNYIESERSDRDFIQVESNPNTQRYVRVDAIKEIIFE